jgi:FHA domain
MGKIRNRTTEQTRQLEAEHVVGRASTCALRLGERFVSAQHGSLRWTGSHWELRDLASTNGTYLDGERITPCEHHHLRLGSRISFGRREPEWELVDPSPPVIMATPLDDGDPVLLDEELIAIPSTEEPRATIYRAADGSWILEQSMSAAPITDQQVFAVDDKNWKFCHTHTLYKTSLTSLIEVEVRELSLSFDVSRDEEYVRLRASGGVHKFDLGAHSYHYLLLTLARRRLADLEEGVADPSSGWVYQEDLSHDPSMAPPQLNLDVFRLRKQFATLGIVDAANIVERRPRTRQLRIGTARLQIIVV